METKITRVKRVNKPSYTEQLMSLRVGEEARFRIIGSAYTSFYSAKWRIEKAKKATFKMYKADDKTLSVTRIN